MFHDQSLSTKKALVDDSKEQQTYFYSEEQRANIGRMARVICPNVTNIQPCDTNGVFSDKGSNLGFVAPLYDTCFVLACKLCTKAGFFFVPYLFYPTLDTRLLLLEA